MAILQDVGVVYRPLFLFNIYIFVIYFLFSSVTSAANSIACVNKFGRMIKIEKERQYFEEV